MAESWRKWLSAWDGYRIEAEEYRELDAERVIVEFRGAGRRLEQKGIAGGVTVLDSYAHHPAELAADLAAIREAGASTSEEEYEVGLVSIAVPVRWSISWIFTPLLRNESSLRRFAKMSK